MTPMTQDAPRSDLRRGARVALRCALVTAVGVCGRAEGQEAVREMPDEVATQVTPPRPIGGGPVPYPAAAFADWPEELPLPEGTVTLRLDIGHEGDVIGVQEVTRPVPEDAPHPALTMAAMSLAKRLRFEPARRGEDPIAVRILYEVPFRAPTRAIQRSARGGATGANDDGHDTAGTPLRVVVTGARMAEHQTDAVVVTDVIDGPEIALSGARDAAEALAHQPALQLRRSFRGTELWLRGLDPEYTLVLLDGDRMIGRSGGAIDLTRVGVEGIERIEIVRGPASALYGSDALAGVVNIIPRRGGEGSLGRASVRGGVTPGSSGLGFDATAWATQALAQSLTLQVTAGAHGTGAVAAEAGGVTSLSGRRQWSVGTAADYRPGKAHHVRASLDYDRQTLDGIDGGAGGARYTRTQVREQFTTGLGYRYRPSSDHRLSLSYRGTLFREQLARDQQGSGALDSVEEGRESLHQATGMYAWTLADGHTLTGGVEQLVQHLRAPRLASRGERYRTSVFAQHAITVFRTEHPERPLCDQQLGLVPGVRIDIDSQFGRQLSPKLAARFDPAPCVSLRASYGRGFRAPSFQQLLLRFENPAVGYVVAGNPDLAAERSHGLDLSASYSPASEVRVFVAAFANDLSNMIATVTVDDDPNATRFGYDNIERATTMGLEGRIHIAPWPWLSADLSYTFTRARNEALDQPLEGVARHRPTLQFRARHRTSGLSAMLRASALLGRVYLETRGEEARRVVAPALPMAGARVAYSFGPHIEGFLGVDNLLDANDRFTTLRPRTFYAGLNGRYGEN